MVPILTPMIAFLLPVYVIYRYYRQRPLPHAYRYCMASLAAGMGAVCIEVHTIGMRCAAGDFAGIADTILAVKLICIAIAVITLLLNTLALAAAYEKE